MATMRAKMKVFSVQVTEYTETLTFGAVAAGKYPEDGSDENNTYAKFTPSAKIEITVANPELHGKFRPGETFYVDFTPAN